MVFFTCNNCGDSLKKNKVENHNNVCYITTISCIDCLKDFTLATYSSHTECISEDQKYGGPNYKAKENKGKAKQNAWIQRVKNLIEQNTYPNDVKFLLNSLLKYENIPRKKAKFINFIKNSFRIRDEILIGKVWNIFESSIKNENNQPVNNNHSVQKESLVLPKPVADVVKVNGDNSSIQDNDNKEKQEDQNGSYKEDPKITMKRTISDILSKHGELSVKKLKKKVLKRYHEMGFEDDSEIIEKFERKLKKPRFINNDDRITLAIKE